MKIRDIYSNMLLALSYGRRYNVQTKASNEATHAITDN